MLWVLGRGSVEFSVRVLVGAVFRLGLRLVLGFKLGLGLGFCLV